MKKLFVKYRKMKPLPALCAAAAAALLAAVVLEVFVFRFSYFAQFFSGCEEMSINLGELSGWNGEALVILPEDGTVAFDGLSLKVRSVTVATSGTSGVLTGNIGICDEANAYKTVGAGSFSVNPGGSQNTFTVRISSRGDLTRLRITFDDELEDPVFLLSVTLNARESLSPNLLRILLIACILGLVLLIVKFRPYAVDFDPDRRSHRFLSHGVMAVCIIISLGILYAESPDHALLRSYPTLDEVRSTEYVVDAYMQQLDAFEKGQIELDLDVNPELEELDNPYDTGERNEKEVSYHWDRAYYNGKYYSYFGLAPLFTVYYPVYLMTGSLPTTVFAAALLAVFAIVCVFAAVRSLIRLFAPRADLLLFLLGEAAVVCGSFIYLIQSSEAFYYLPLLSAVGWLAAFTAFAVTAARSVAAESCGADGDFEKSATGSAVREAAATAPEKDSAAHGGAAWKAPLLFALSGLSFVMIVLSRPTMALFAVLFAIPLFVRVLRDRNIPLRKRILGSALPFLIPVVIGAAGIMWYNYVRFDSVFEFGTSYQLTESDIRYNSLSLSLKNFSGMFYHYFVESFVYGEFFPFVSFTSEKCIDFGNYLYQEVSAGLLGMPLNLGFFLIFPFAAGGHRAVKAARGAKDSRGGKAGSSGRDSRGFRLLSVGFNPRGGKYPLALVTAVLLILGVIAIGYADFMLGGIHIRYVCDLSLVVSLLAFMLILDQVHLDTTRASRILYVLAVAAMAATIILGLLLIFSNETNFILENNPDFYLKISRIFHA